MELDPKILAQLDEEQMQHLPIYFFTKNMTGTYISCNDFMAKALGFNKGTEVVGSNDFDLSWMETAPILRSHDNEVINTEKSRTYLEAGRLADGENSNALSYKWPLRLKSKKIAGIMCVSMPFAKEILQNSPAIESLAIKYEITQRQKDCLQYLTKGMTIKEIANRLNLSPRTVEHYIEALKMKLNCHSRSQLVAMISQEQDQFNH